MTKTNMNNGKGKDMRKKYDYDKVMKFVKRHSRTLGELEEKFGIPYMSLYLHAKKHGWQVEIRQYEKVEKVEKVMKNGCVGRKPKYDYKKVYRYTMRYTDKTIRELSDKFDIPYISLYNMAKKDDWNVKIETRG